MSEVWVTNESDKDLEASFAFVDYKFPKGKTVQVPLGAVRHIFGYMDSNKEKYLSYLGFIRLHSELEEGLERLAKFKISEQPPEQNRSLPSAVGVIPLRIEKSAGGKVNSKAA